MMSLALVCLLMLSLLSPIKVAFSVVMVSLLTSVLSYSVSTSAFPASAVVISFSSGMMILFCYCAMATTYESKNYKSKLTLVWVLAMVPLMAVSENLLTSGNEEMMVKVSASPLIMVAMGVVLVAMTSINLSMFTPSKSLISSY